MTPETQTYRVSRRFLANLWKQAMFASLGIVVSSLLFWAVSSLLLSPLEVWGYRGQGFESYSEFLQLDFWTSYSQHRDREILRFGIGLFLTVAVWLGGLGDYLAWSPVRYEVRDDKLILRWRYWTRAIAWDVIRLVDERPHKSEDMHSLLIHSTGEPPILVRGLEKMPEFIQTLKARLSPLAEWSTAKVTVDMTSPLVNFVIGILIPIPLHATWMLAYVAGWRELSIMTLWSIVLVPISIGLWFGRPLSRCHSCAREVELALAILMLILSGLFSLILWMDSPWGTWTMSLFF